MQSNKVFLFPIARLIIGIQNAFIDIKNGVKFLLE